MENRDVQDCSLLGLVVSGDKRTFVELVIPIAEELEAAGLSRSKDSAGVFRRSSPNQPVAFLTAADALVMVGIYVSVKFLDRVIEQVWDEKLWPPISKVLKDCVGKRPRKRRYRIGISVGFGKGGSSLIVIAIGKDSDDIDKQQQSFGKVIKLFESQVPLPVDGVCYRYLVENGIISGPETFADHASAVSGLAGMDQDKEIKFVRPES